MRAFWNDRETVARFAGREPDLRLADLVPTFAHPARVRILDLGCAGGRNAVFLLDRGFDVLALDSAPAMVEETARRLEEIQDGASERASLGRMDDLGRWPEGHFDLVVALGVYHNAESRDEWERSLRETARVTSRGGLVLVANFTPDTDPTGEGIRPVPGEPHVFEGFASGQVSLYSGAELDAEFAAAGFAPSVPTQIVCRETSPGRRVTANALFVRR